MRGSARSCHRRRPTGVNRYRRLRPSEGSCSLSTSPSSSRRPITPARLWRLTFRYLANANSEGNGNGNWLQFLSFAPPEGPNSESTFASAPANDPDPKRPKNHLHYNPYPKTAAPGQGNVCEAGNEKYVRGETIIGNSPELWGTKTRGQVQK